jgi:fatty acid CoA ligase FadD28
MARSKPAWIILGAFGGRLVAPSAGTKGPSLHTEDAGFYFDDEVFVIGPITDL